MNIIQTWKTKNIPSYYHNYVNNIKYLHPQWNYMFFDDNDIVRHPLVKKIINDYEKFKL